MGLQVTKATGCFVLKNMKVIGAYMLAVVGGNASPSVADCKKILSSMNIQLDGDAETRLNELVEEMAGKDFNEVLAAGQEKLSKIPCGSGGGGAAPAAAAAAAPGGAAPAAAKKEESEDDVEAAPAASLFDDGGDDY